MAIDPNPPSHATDRVAAGPRINDDLPAYRAISGLAIICLILGIASVFTFTSAYFALLGVGSVVMGLLSQRSIRRFPDALTGEGMIRVGIGASLLFCLSALTMQGVQEGILRIEANRFARYIEPTLRTGSLEDILLLKTLPSSRKGKTAIELADEMKKGAQNPMGWDMETKSIRDFKARLASSPDQTLTYKGVDTFLTDGLNLFATATFEIQGTASKEFPAPVMIARARLRGMLEEGKNAWRLEDLHFPDK